jgi:DNA invertase Pin-like site-specific DNA recombinase
MPKRFNKYKPETQEQLREACLLLRFRCTDHREIKRTYHTYSSIAKALRISTHQVQHLCNFKPKRQSELEQS